MRLPLRFVSVAEPSSSLYGDCITQLYDRAAPYIHLLTMTCRYWKRPNARRVPSGLRRIGLHGGKCSQREQSGKRDSTFELRLTSSTCDRLHKSGSVLSDDLVTVRGFLRLSAAKSRR